MSVIFVSFFFILGFAVTGALRPLYFVEVGADPVQLGLLMAVPSIVAIFTRVPRARARSMPRIAWGSLLP